MEFSAIAGKVTSAVYQQALPTPQMDSLLRTW